MHRRSFEEALGAPLRGEERPNDGSSVLASLGRPVASWLEQRVTLVPHI
jgi:hypothetical protein